MTEGQIQKMSRVFSLRWANTIPAVIAAGRAGGITMVMRSNVLIMSLLFSGTLCVEGGGRGGV